MYSIIELCGEQVKVAAGNKIQVSSLEGEAGKTFDFDKVLLFSDGTDITVGKPYLSDARVKATLLSQLKGDKVVVFKKRRRKDYKKKTGHRQLYTELLITEVSMGSKKDTYKPVERKAKPAAADKKEEAPKA